MRHCYLVTYDICNEKRLRNVHKKMCGFGDHLQYSVFRCELTDSNKVRMVAALSDVINHDEDQVLMFNLGPADGIRTDMVEALGLPVRHRTQTGRKYTPSEHGAVVV